MIYYNAISDIDSRILEPFRCADGSQMTLR